MLSQPHMVTCWDPSCHGPAAPYCWSQYDVLKRLELFYFFQTQQMASKGGPKKGCVGNPLFDPDERVHDTAAREEAFTHLQKDEFRDAISSWFRLPKTDNYVYHAITSVLLAQVQDIVDRGRDNGLHDWYQDEAGAAVSLPPYSPSTDPAIADTLASFRRHHHKT